MAAGAGDGHAKTAAAQGAIYYCAVTSAFERDGRANALCIGRWPEEIAHAAQVALALFADVGREEEGAGGFDLCRLDGRNQAQKSGQSGSVVAGAGAENA